MSGFPQWLMDHIPDNIRDGRPYGQVIAHSTDGGYVVAAWNGERCSVLPIRTACAIELQRAGTRYVAERLQVTS